MRRRHTAADMHAIAAAHGGRFVSLVFTGMMEKHEWECRFGHPFHRTPSRIIHRGTFCPHCSRFRYTTEAIRAIVEAEGNEYVSGTIRVREDEMTFRCPLRHEFTKTAAALRVTPRCPFCAPNAPLTLADVQEMAVSRGGECLAAAYRHVKEALPWRCAEGHPFSASTNRVRNGSWCPWCWQSIAERFARIGLEHMLGFSLPPASPPWLGKGVGGGTLRLDGYNEAHRVAFEYNGQQHDIPRGSGPEGEAAFLRYRENDRLKAERARAAGVLLIVVPYFPSPAWHLRAQHLRHAVEITYAVSGLSLPPLREGMPEFAAAYRTEGLDRLRRCADSMDLELLPTAYRGIDATYRLRCQRGHEFPLTGATLLRGPKHPCRRCEWEQEGLRILRALAARCPGGASLATRYRGTDAVYLFWCGKADHDPFLRNAAALRDGHAKWCPDCEGGGYRRRDSIEDLRDEVRGRGGDCLGWVPSRESTDPPQAVFRGMHEFYVWRCAHGHPWPATAANVCSNGTWCPACEKTARGGRRRTEIRNRYSSRHVRHRRRRQAK